MHNENMELLIRTNKKTGKYKNWKEREHHVQENSYVSHKYVNMFLNKNQFPSFPFCVPHTKPHGFIGLRKHYHMIFDPKLGYVICAILQITCACVECMSILDKPLTPGLPPQQQAQYQTVEDCIYQKVLESFNNWDIITLSHKSVTSEAFDKIHQVLLHDTSKKLVSLVQPGEYGATKKQILQQWANM